MKIYWHDNRKNVIGTNVKRLRKAAGLTQDQLSVKLQLLEYEFDRVTIGRIETGDRFVPDYEVKALADVFGVSTDRLFEKNN